MIGEHPSFTDAVDEVIDAALEAEAATTSHPETRPKQKRTSSSERSASSRDSLSAQRVSHSLCSQAPVSRCSSPASASSLSTSRSLPACAQHS